MALDYDVLGFPKFPEKMMFKIMQRAFFDHKQTKTQRKSIYNCMKYRKTAKPLIWDAGLRNVAQ